MSPGGAGFAALVDELGRRKAATVVATLGRAIWAEWQLGKPEEAHEAEHSTVRPGFDQLCFRQERVKQRFTRLLGRRLVELRPEADRYLHHVHAHLAEVGEAWNQDLWQADEDVYRYGNLILRPRQLLESCGRGPREQVSLLYFLRRDIRERFKLVDSHMVVRCFNILAASLNRLVNQQAPSSARGVRRISVLDYGGHGGGRGADRESRPKLLDELAATTRPEGISESRWNETVRAFVEGCVLVGYLEAGGFPGTVVTRTAAADPEYLIANLFGLPTAIPGLDTLFGGGGLRLRERIEAGTDAVEPAPGRILLVRGARGSGKSCLSIQLACEVASKGGCAFVVLMEATPADALYIMSSFAGGSEPNFNIATTRDEAVDAILDARRDRGTLILLRGETGSLEGLFLFLEWVAKMLAEHSLTLLVVDPLSAVYDPAPLAEPQLRERTHSSLQAVRRAGINLLLIAEDGSYTTFIENMADTITDMSVVDEEGYSQRRIEISKSRYQREQRGTHTFSIKPGTGIHVFPSTASVSARLRGRGGPARRTPIAFGHADLNQHLGEGALETGDVIAFHGALSGVEVYMALPFLLTSNGQPNGDLKPGSLLISSREDDDELRHILSEERLREVSRGVSASMSEASRGQTAKAITNLRTLSLPGGLVDPGVILQAIQDAFHAARSEGLLIDRVVVDGLAYWELSSPMVRKDPVFGPTLIDLLRKAGATQLLICGADVDNSEWQLQKAAIEHADCRIRFHSSPETLELQIERTRTQRHSRSRLSVKVDHDWTVHLTPLEDQAR